MARFLGIDLGTTNSVVAYRINQTEVVTGIESNRNNGALTPSVVSQDSSGQFVVGTQAVNRIKQQPDLVVSSIKRLMGRGFADPAIQNQVSKFPYKVSQKSDGTENSIVVHLNGKEYEPEDFSAEILKQMISNAIKYQISKGITNPEIAQVVITVPAYFDDKQREATRVASLRANIAYAELLPEPTAAAISFGFKPGSDDVETLLVYDFGGGTFDSSLLTVANGDQFIESGKEGDLWLGGDDLDEKLIDLILKKVAEEEDLDDVRKMANNMPKRRSNLFWASLGQAAEKAKIDLSTQEKTRIILDDEASLQDELGMAIPINVEITRTEFEAVIKPLVNRTLELCRKTLEISEYPLDMVDKILLVGGSSQIPLVQQLMRAAFGEDKVVVHPRPMTAVAEGAAIVASGMIEKVGSVSRDYCIELIDEPRFKLIRRNEPIAGEGIKKSHTFKTQSDGQRLVHLKFYNIDDNREADNKIGEAWLILEKAYSKGTEIQVLSYLDESKGGLTISACLRNDPSQKVVANFSRGGHDEKLNQEISQLINDLNEEGDLTEYGAESVNDIAGKALLAVNTMRNDRGETQESYRMQAEAKLKELRIMASDSYGEATSLISTFEFVVQACADLLDPGQVQRLQHLKADLETALERHDQVQLEALVSKGRQEMRLLPEDIETILAYRFAVARAISINPTHGRVMAEKFSNLVMALKDKNPALANQYLQELQKDAVHYLDQQMPTVAVATGITK